MTFTESIKSVFRNYANIDGRAIRSEYWWFALACVILQIVAAIMGSGYASGFLGFVLLVIGLAILIPSVTVGVRRLHDTDKTGWWMLLAFVPFGGLVLLVFFAMKGTDGPNRFGPDYFNVGQTTTPGIELKKM